MARDPWKDLTHSIASIRDAQSPTEVKKRQVLKFSEDRTELLAKVRTALAQEAWSRDGERIGAIATQLRQIQDSAVSVQAGMVEMGRRLNKLQDLAGEGGYKALHKAGLVPIVESTASELRAIAAAVDEGKIAEDRLPRAVRAAAIAARLPTEDARSLVRSGVIGPETTAKQMRAILEPKPVDRVEQGPLRPAEIKRLKARLKAIAEIRRKLDAEEERIRRRLESAK